MKVRYFENTAQFVQKLKLTGGAYQIEGYLDMALATMKNCPPPTSSFHSSPARQKGLPKEAAAAALKRKPKNSPRRRLSPTWFRGCYRRCGRADGNQGGGQGGPMKPVISEPIFGRNHFAEDMSWIYIFITGFAGGLLALFTPVYGPSSR